MVPKNVLQVLLSEKYEIAKNSTTTIDKEKISTDLESLEFLNFFVVCLTKVTYHSKLMSLSLTIVN